MTLRAALSPVVISFAFFGATALLLQFLTQAAGRRLYFVSGWLLVLLVSGMLVLLRRRQLAQRSKTVSITKTALLVDALFLPPFIALLGLHTEMGLPEGTFEFLLFGLLIAIALLGITIHLTLVVLSLGSDESRALAWSKRLDLLLDIQIPLLLASLPIMLLHGVLSHAHGALSHLVKGGHL